MSKTKPRRGEVWDVDFDPPRNAEISKTRPAVVISEGSINAAAGIRGIGEF